MAQYQHAPYVMAVGDLNPQQTPANGHDWCADCQPASDDAVQIACAKFSSVDLHAHAMLPGDKSDSDISRARKNYYSSDVVAEQPETTPKRPEEWANLDFLVGNASRLSLVPSRASSRSSHYSQDDEIVGIEGVTQEVDFEAIYMRKRAMSNNANTKFERDLINDHLARTMGAERERIVPSPLGIRIPNRLANTSYSPATTESSPLDTPDHQALLSRLSFSTASSTPPSLVSGSSTPSDGTHSRSTSTSSKAPPTAVSKYSALAQNNTPTTTTPGKEVPRFSWQSAEAENALRAWMTGEKYDTAVIPAPAFEPSVTHLESRQLPASPPAPIIPERSPRRLLPSNKSSTIAEQIPMSLPPASDFSHSLPTAAAVPVLHKSRSSAFEPVVPTTPEEPMPESVKARPEPDPSSVTASQPEPQPRKRSLSPTKRRTRSKTSPTKASPPEETIRKPPTTASTSKLSLPRLYRRSIAASDVEPIVPTLSRRMSIVGIMTKKARPSTTVKPDPEVARRMSITSSTSSSVAVERLASRRSTFLPGTQPGQEVALDLAAGYWGEEERAGEAWIANPFAGLGLGRSFGRRARGAGGYCRGKIINSPVGEALTAGTRPIREDLNPKRNAEGALPAPKNKKAGSVYS